MTWHNKNGTGGMPDNVFRSTPDKDVFESSRSMGGSHNHVRLMFERAGTNLLTGVPDLQRRLHFDSLPICLFNQIAHLTPR